MEEKLRTQAKNAIFQRDFREAFNKYVDEKRQASIQPYADRVDHSEYRIGQSMDKLKPFTVEDDCKLNLKKWASCLKDCAYYYDDPSLDQERTMKKKLQFRYDDLFQDGWRPPLQSRQDLLMWVCNNRNEWLETKGKPEAAEECIYGGLLEKYGPDYSKLQAKLGHVRGLFDE